MNALTYTNGHLSSHLIRHRSSGAVYRVSEFVDTPCGAYLKVCCVDYGSDPHAGQRRTIAWSMRGAFNAIVPIEAGGMLG